jgi:CoA-transferase family III
MAAVGIPLAGCADQILQRLAIATGSAAIAKLDGTTLLGERAMLAGMTIPGRTSAGGGCRLHDALNDTVALNLSRPSDRELLPALFETDGLDPNDDAAVAAQIARCDAAALVSRGRSMGLAIAAEHEAAAHPNIARSDPRHDVQRPGARHAQAHASRTGIYLTSASDTQRVAAIAHPHLLPQTLAERLTAGPPPEVVHRRPPRVLDLSALWAGPLASHLLWLAGAHVIKVESRTRPDAMRDGDNAFFALLNQGKLSVALDFKDADDRRALLSLIATSDIVIEAARPRALMQLGIDADEIVRNTPGLVWITLTGHGAAGEAANWVGFGDDCGVAGGLSAALRAATGETGFVGDAIADPLTGLTAAAMAWENWKSGQGGRFALAMRDVIANFLAAARQQDPADLQRSLVSWRNATGKQFPTVQRRAFSGPAPLGEHTNLCRTDASHERHQLSCS